MPGIDNEELIKKISDVVLPILELEGIDLVELNVSGYKKDLFVQVLADKSTGGIRIADCVRLNKMIVGEIDRLAVLDPEGYALEVSSPGLDRPLQTAKDFKRNLNRMVHFEFAEPVEGKNELEAMVASVSGQELVITLKNKKQAVVALSNIIKAVLVI